MSGRPRSSVWVKPGHADVFVDSWAGGHPVRARISAKVLREPVSLGDRELYATKHGNLSLRAARSAGDAAEV